MSNVSRPVLLKQVLCDVVCSELTLTSWCVTAVAFIVVDRVSVHKKNKTLCNGTGVRRRFFLFVLANATTIYITLKHLCTWVRGAMGKGFCAKCTESFWVRVTIDGLTDKQCCFSLTEPVDNDCMSRVISCMFFRLAAFLVICCV